VQSLSSLFSEVGKKADQLIKYFGEDPVRCPFEQVMSTLLTFVTMFRKAHEENVKQAELEKKKAQKEAAEAEKSKSAQLASKNVLILDYTCFTCLLNPKSSFMYVF